MAFGKWSVVLACSFICLGMVQAQEIELELQMPGTMFGPGSPFYLDLEVVNTGSALSDAQLFVALTVGTGDFWFYPSWVMFPHEIDWTNVFVPPNALCQWMILPMFSWPYGAGAFEGAMFIAAILHNGMLMSNLADVTFGWSETPQPTPTPASPPDLVFIAPGSFTMGSPSDEPCRYSNETEHPVTLTRGFYMMTTEVTRQMWVDLKAVQPTLPSDPSDTTYSPTLNHPVQNNSWYEAVLFANLMSLRDGLTRCYYTNEAFTVPVNALNYTTGPITCNFNATGYRLPTEAEWEYACRAGTTGPFSCSEPNYNSGNCESWATGTHPTLEQYCVYWANSHGKTMMTGSKLPNPWGLYDMHGNVWEWCWDCYEDYPSGPVTDPTGPSTSSFRVYRGGSWNFSARYCRSANRDYGNPDPHYDIWGFRLVRTAD